jgi:hypothetical protein
MLDAAVRVFTGNKPGTRTNSELTPEASKCALQINGASRLKVIVLRFGLALRGLRLAEPVYRTHAESLEIPSPLCSLDRVAAYGSPPVL